VCACMRIWCFDCFTDEEEEGRLKQSAMDNNNNNNNNEDVDLDLNERELGVSEDERWPMCEEMMRAATEEEEEDGTELEQLCSSEIRSHPHLVLQGESSNAAAAAAVGEDCTMEEADHDSYHKRAKVYSGLA